jgi:hypothetical protein
MKIYKQGYKMTVESSLKEKFYCPSIYRIRVAGRLNPSWSERFQGLTISNIEEKDGSITSELFGELPDQAALLGVLQELYNYGVALLGAECDAVTK